MIRPMLGDLELEQVQLVEDDEGQVVTRHPVPGLEGDFLQDLGRRAARLRLTGVLTSAGTVEHLGALREKFHAGEPVGFVSDITSATLIDQVLIERMEVTELAGRPSVFEYRFDLREFLEAKPPPTEDVIVPPPPPPDVENGKLAVTVVAEGDPAFDMDRVRVSVRGTEQKTGTDLNRVLTNRTSPNVWFEDPFPAGDYTADALVDDTRTPTGQREVLTGSATVHVDDGQVASVTITLRRGAKIGTVFVITFHFDKAFVEPCMRHVLQQVVTYANQHADEKLLIVGHTDLVGPPTYNQALSERRGRATYAMMTFGSDPQKSIAEWNELRRERPAGTINTVKDTWGTREIQHMLQDLGLYQGNVGVSTGEDATLTDAAIKKFQRDHGLADDGIVGDATWPVLIEAYLGNDPVNLPTAQLVANRNDSGCDSGPLRWLGCSEQDPVLNTEDAWRPNRRTELMFVHEPALPCPVPKPVTLDQVADGAGGGGWCLDDGTATAVDCFVVPWDKPCPTGAPDPHRPWCRQPAEPGSFTVRGAIHFDDGTPFTGTHVLIAADGEFMDNEVPVTPPSGTPRAGTPNRGRPQADGTFSYAKQKGPGIFSIAVDGPFVVSAGEALEDVKGNVVCSRLTGEQDADIVVVDRAVAFVQPSITAPDGIDLDKPQPQPLPPPKPKPSVSAKDAVVIVRKPHTNPARRPVVLKVSKAFTGSGAFTVSKPGQILFFDAVTNGNPVATGAVFTSAQLVAGVTIFADGAAASDKAGDVELKLSLTVDGKKGLSGTLKMTAVELTLDIHQSRTAAGTAPAPLATAQKLVPGRFIHVQDAGLHHGRAMITVRQPKPADFTGTLALSALDATTANPRERLFGAADEVAAAGQAPLGTSTKIATKVPAAGVRFWVEGVRVSAAQHDCGFQLGIDGLEPDGDRVALTVVQFSNLQASVPGTPPRTARLGNALPGPQVFTVGASGFDEDPAVNLPLPLVENSVRAGDEVVLTVAVAPAGTPVRWDAMRASGIPAASGGDDAAAIVALHAAKKPTVRPAVGNDLRATLLADNTGTFHVRPFVDCNGNNTFDYHVDREPNMVLNLVLGRATLFLDSSLPHGNFVVAGTPGGGISLASGTFNIANPATAAVHMNAQVDVVTGGASGRRVIDQFFGGWFNNVVGATLFTPTYTDPGPPAAAHPEPFVFASNGAAATGPGGEFIPGDPPPALVVPPILDSGRGGAGSGGDSAALGQSRIRLRTNQAVGERWIVEAVDSPAVQAGLVGGGHPVVAAARLTRFLTRLRFACHLTVWTNLSKSSGPTAHPADRQYAVLERVVWQMNGEWAVSPGTGTVTQVTAPATAITSRVKTSPAVAVAGTDEEVRPPAAVPLAVKDARA